MKPVPAGMPREQDMRNILIHTLFATAFSCGPAPLGRATAPAPAMVTPAPNASAGRSALPGACAADQEWSHRARACEPARPGERPGDTCAPGGGGTGRRPGVRCAAGPSLQRSSGVAGFRNAELPVRARAALVGQRPALWAPAPGREARRSLRAGRRGFDRVRALRHGARPALRPAPDAAGIDRRPADLRVRGGGVAPASREMSRGERQWLWAGMTHGVAV